MQDRGAMQPVRSAEDRRYLDVAVQAAREAGAIQMDCLGKVKVGFKSSFSDLVTEADKLSEEAVRERIARHFPNHGFWGEEGGESSREAPMRWIVDPIDGTTNYAHGLPLFAVSIALEDEHGPRVAVIYAPALDECFTAVRGEGAYLNGRRLQVSRASRLEESLLVTGFPYIRGNGDLPNFAQFRALTVRSRGVRRLGSAAMDLAWVAAGRLDGFWEIGLKAWDMAAGVLLVQEAGGTVTGLRGAPFRLDGGEIVATNGRIHAEMLAALEEAGSA